MALNAQLAANNTTLPQFQVDHPTWNGDGSLTAGNMQASQAGANLTGSAMEGEMDLYAAILPGGIAAKEGGEAAAAARAAAAKDCPSSLPKVAKAVNSNLPHAAAQAAERGVFDSAGAAADALRDLSKSITQNGFPVGTLPDTAYADRVLVPIGNNGLAVYQVGANGTAILKTVLIAH
jgi:hypothetical protein